MKKYRFLQNILFYSVFLFYIVILLQVLLFKSVPVWQVFSENRRILRDINLVPFYYFTTDDAIARTFAFSNVFGNIVLFIPMGIYIPSLIRNKKFFRYILTIFLISLSVEIIQYIFAIGITDIDDIILNCVGGLIGIAIYKVLLFVAKDIDKTRLIITIIAPIAGAVLIFLVAIFG